LIKENSKIPIIGNGGVETFQDINRFIEYTKVDAVMSAEKLLEIPYLFAGDTNDYNIDEVALEYLAIAKEDNTDINMVRSHLHKMLYGACKVKA
jgi:tRNA-dihydrouridine synthase